MSNRRKAILLLLGAILIGMAFTMWSFPEDQPKKSFFPFFRGYGSWDGKMTAENFAYGYFETLAVAMILLAGYVETGTRLWNVCFWLYWAEGIDYLLCYNSGWFSIGTFEFEFNYVKYGLICLYALKEWRAS